MEALKKLVVAMILLAGFLWLADIAIERITGVGLFMRLGY